MHPLTDVWWRLFINRTDGALRRGRSGWVYAPQRLTLYEVEAALRGQVSLGVYAADSTGLSRWLCLDADTDEGRLALAQVAARLDPTCSLLELSRRGAHLWRVCPPTPWSQVRTYGEYLLEQVGLRCEIFPKGPARTGVRLPATRHPRTGEIYPIIDPATGVIRERADLGRLVAQPLPELPHRPQPNRRPATDYGSAAFDQLRREVEQTTDLRHYGPERAVGCCPFHDDQHPSLSLLGGFWRCWAGCGEGGLNAWRSLARKRGKEVNDDDLYPTQ